MRKLIVHEFISLDRVVQAPGGQDEDRDGGFAYGGWTVPYWHDDMGATFFQAMQSVDAFLFGRRTYQIHGRPSSPWRHGVVLSMLVIAETGTRKGDRFPLLLSQTGSSSPRFYPIAGKYGR
jgi:hypothetical protein